MSVCVCVFSCDAGKLDSKVVGQIHEGFGEGGWTPPLPLLYTGEHGSQLLGCGVRSLFVGDAAKVLYVGYDILCAHLRDKTLQCYLRRS